MIRLRAFSLLAAGASSALPVAAQPATPLPVGARVRAFSLMTPPDRVVGTVVRVDSAALIVLPAHATVPTPLPFSALRRVEVSRGRRSPAAAFGHGAGIGAIVGGVLGVVTIGAAAISQRHQSCDCFVPPVAVASVLGVGVTILTTTTGGLIGLAHRERWAPWSIPSGTP